MMRTQTTLSVLFSLSALLGGCAMSDLDEAADGLGGDGPGGKADGLGEDPEPEEAPPVTPEELAQLTVDINGALEGLEPDQVYTYCTNGVPFNIPFPGNEDLEPIGCRTVILFKDADGVSVHENADPTDDIIMDNFASGERQVCSTAWFWRNGRTLASGEPSWSVAADRHCNGAAANVIDDMAPHNRDVRITLAPDGFLGELFPTVHELRTHRLEPDGTTTVLKSKFEFGESEVFLRQFVTSADGVDETTREIHYYRAHPELLP